MTDSESAQVPFDRYVIFFCLAGGGVAWDLYSKWAVFSSLGCPGAGEWVWPNNWGWNGLAPLVRFQLRTNFNHGALWGMGQGLAPVFAGLSILAGLGILYWLFIHRGATSRWLTTALGFVMAGVLGNLYDRMGLHGWKDQATQQPVYAVRDFLHFWFFEGTPAEFHWAIFNFADSFLVTGAVMLVIHSLLWQPADALESSTATVTAGTRT